MKDTRIEKEISQFPSKLKGNNSIYQKCLKGLWLELLKTRCSKNPKLAQILGFEGKFQNEKSNEIPKSQPKLTKLRSKSMVTQNHKIKMAVVSPYIWARGVYKCVQYIYIYIFLSHTPKLHARVRPGIYIHAYMYKYGRSPLRVKVGSKNK